MQKIPTLAGFEPLPVEAKTSKAHAVPSEIAGPGLGPIYSDTKTVSHNGYLPLPPLNGAVFLFYWVSYNMFKVVNLNF